MGQEVCPALHAERSGDNVILPSGSSSGKVYKNRPFFQQAEDPCHRASAPTTLKTGVGKRRDLTDTSLCKEVSHEQEVYRPTFG